MTLAERIKAVKDLPSTELFVKEWDMPVWVRAMDAKERADLEKRFHGRTPDSDPADFRTTLIALTVLDENGERAFTLDDIAWLKDKNAAAIESIFAVACEKNAFTKRDVEELQKN